MSAIAVVGRDVRVSPGPGALDKARDAVRGLLRASPGDVTGGFDQVPTGSNCDRMNQHNLAETVEHCKKIIAPERLRGFMMGSWARTQREEENRFRQAIDLTAEAVRHFGA